MTDFLRKLAVFLQKHSEGVQVVRQLSSEDTIEPPEEEGGFSRALLVPEPDRKEFGVFEVPRSDEPTQFTHFIDGIQHSQLLYYQLTKHGVMPVVYGYVAAMVLERRNRELHPAPDLIEAQEALYLPLKAFDASLFEQAGITVHDSLEERELVNTSFQTMLVRAGATVARVRDQLERKLALRWIEQQKPDSGDWLLVDGSIADLMSALERRRLVNVVGVSKSHRTSYLEINWMLKVLSMPAGVSKQCVPSRARGAERGLQLVSAAALARGRVADLRAGARRDARADRPRRHARVGRQNLGVAFARDAPREPARPTLRPPALSVSDVRAAPAQPRAQ
jgi:hypothetical protein